MEYYRVKDDKETSSTGDIISVDGDLPWNYRMKQEVPHCNNVQLLQHYAPVYKGENVKVTFLYDAEGAYTLRESGENVSIYSSSVKANSVNGKLTVAKNKAKLKRKNYLRKDYKTSREKAKKANLSTSLETCDLLSKWRDRKDKITYPIIGSGKVDGIRCTKYKDNILTSRGGIEIKQWHILRECNAPEWLMDGELYIPGKSFEYIQGVVSRGNTERYGEVHWFIFDIPVALPFLLRLDRLKELEGELTGWLISKYIHFIPHRVLNNEEEANDFYRECVGKGFEGCVYRTLDGVYKGSRTAEVIKRKPLFSREFKITKILFDKDSLVYYELECEKGTFKSVPSWSDEKRSYDIHKYGTDKGKYAEVEYQDLTAKGIPKFTNVKVIRETRKGEDGEITLIY